ncbi:MAG TPA: hypothetical protein VGM82_05980 [Gemmatimonadaceae bacterium]|jgi:hypothetical protein
MSIYGIGNSSINRPTTNFPVRDNTRTQGQQPSTVATPATLPQQAPAKNATGAAATGQSVPADPPAGTDPALWSILSGEERAFFAKAGATGPLTYGRAFTDMKSTQLPANRGGRLDVKI